MADAQGQQVVIAVSPKNVGIAIILTVLFGPLGMFYSTVKGAIIMMVVALVLAVCTFFIGGAGAFLAWPFCVIWAGVAANNHNKKLYLL